MKTIREQYEAFLEHHSKRVRSGVTSPFSGVETIALKLFVNYIEQQEAKSKLNEPTL